MTFAIYGSEQIGNAIEKQPSKLKGRKLEPKYKDPVSGKTWAGRGRLPKWVVGDKEQFRI